MRESLKVLLVDDEPETVRLLRKVLQADGCTVIEAADGQEALTLFAHESPDLILLDIIIPQVDGIEVLKRIRSQDPVTGIIMVSALTSEKLAVEAMLAGADDYISKPFPLKEIRVRIQQATDKVWLRRETLRLQNELETANARLRQLVARYAPPGVAERGTPASDVSQLTAERLKITALAIGVRNVIRLAESAPPERLISTINQHLSLVTDAVLQEHGVLDKFTGNAVIALFNAPVRQEDHPLRAIRAALRWRDSVQSTQITDDPALRYGIGIHTGNAVVGNVGASQYTRYTAVGDAPDLAWRLQEVAEPEQVLISGYTLAQVKNLIEAKHVGRVNVSGRAEPVDAYAVASLK
ncbi:MAG: response regulator [Anaerolineae bacterium]|nr:response regulator [Anaerolineae bacterium]